MNWRCSDPEIGRGRYPGGRTARPAQRDLEYVSVPAHLTRPAAHAEARSASLPGHAQPQFRTLTRRLAYQMSARLCGRHGNGGRRPLRNAAASSKSMPSLSVLIWTTSMGGGEHVGVKLAISTDAHSTPTFMQFPPRACRAWLGPDDVLNARPLGRAEEASQAPVRPPPVPGWVRAAATGRCGQPLWSGL